MIFYVFHAALISYLSEHLVSFLIFNYFSKFLPSFLPPPPFQIEQLVFASNFSVLCGLAALKSPPLVENMKMGHSFKWWGIERCQCSEEPGSPCAGSASKYEGKKVCWWRECVVTSFSNYVERWWDRISYIVCRPDLQKICLWKSAMKICQKDFPGLRVVLGGNIVTVPVFWN